MKPKKKRKKLSKRIEPEIIVYSKNYLQQVEETLHTMSIGISPKERKKYIDLLIASMREISETNMTIH